MPRLAWVLQEKEGRCDRVCKQILLLPSSWLVLLMAMAWAPQCSLMTSRGYSAAKMCNWACGGVIVEPLLRSDCS